MGVWFQYQSQGGQTMKIPKTSFTVGNSFLLGIAWVSAMTRRNLFGLVASILDRVMTQFVGMFQGLKSCLIGISIMKTHAF